MNKPINIRPKKQPTEKDMQAVIDILEEQCVDNKEEPSIKDQEEAIAYYEQALEHLKTQGFIVLPGITMDGGNSHPVTKFYVMTKSQHEEHLKSLVVD